MKTGYLLKLAKPNRQEMRLIWHESLNPEAYVKTNSACKKQRKKGQKSKLVEVAMREEAVAGAIVLSVERQL